MKRRTIAAALGGILSGWLAGLGFGGHQALADQPGEMVGGGMMPGKSMRDMMSHDNMMGPMKLGMELFERHAGIKRATDYLPNGIIDTTISSDPTTAGIIRAHVIEMYRRLADNRPFPYPMSQSVHVMFENSAKYRRSYKILPDGIEVTETSDDPEMVKVIYAHARELDRFAKDGMPAMMRGMLQRPS